MVEVGVAATRGVMVVAGVTAKTDGMEGMRKKSVRAVGVEAAGVAERGEEKMTEWRSWRSR